MDAPYEVELTAMARSDLLAARRWLTQPGSGLRARLRLARISRALVELEFAPLRWSKGPFPDTRQRFVDGYTLIYRIDDAANAVTVLRVFAPYQDRSSL
jgi:plasmid stabilization system protein ParE